MDGCIGRERRTEGEVDSDQVGMGGLFQKERGYERERGPLPPSLCRQRARTDLSRQEERRRWRRGGREGGRERKRHKNMGGSEVERDLVPVWQPCFFYTSSVGSLLHGNPFDLRQCVTDRDCVCVDRQRVCVSQPLSVLYLFCASVAAGISHAVS